MYSQEKCQEVLNLFLEKWGISASKLGIIIGRDRGYVTRYASGKRPIPKSFIITLYMLDNFRTKEGRFPGIEVWK